MTHLLKIAKSKRDIVAAAAAECSVPVRFFTIENNEDLLQVEFTTSLPNELWYLGLSVGMKISQAIFDNAINTTFKAVKP
jgi:hypothetical protein